MGWGDPPLIFEDEDEAELKSRFVELCAQYPNRTPLEIGEYVFSHLPNAGFRGGDAGVKWSRELEVQERIAAAIRNGGKEKVDPVPDKEIIISEMLALARDPRLDAKDRHSFYRTALEAQGHIVKTVDKTTAIKPPTPPAIVFKAVDFNRDPEMIED